MWERVQFSGRNVIRQIECVTAARRFNRALRATYFALAPLAWILDPIALMLGAAITIGVLYRREFASHSRSILMK